MSQTVYSEEAHATGGDSMADAIYLDFTTRQQAALSEEHWSPRQTLVFAVGSSLMLWGLIGLGLYALV